MPGMRGKPSVLLPMLDEVLPALQLADRAEPIEVAKIMDTANHSTKAYRPDGAQFKVHHAVENPANPKSVQ